MITATNIHIIREKRTVIGDFSITVSPGKIHALIGPNGSGKSTVIRALSGESDFYSGDIFYDQVNVKSIPIKKMASIRSVAAQGQRFGLGFTVSEVLKLATRFHGTQESIDAAMSEVNIESLLNRSVRSLSGGEQQRVSIAMALAQSTPYLLLDEPFSAQDVASVARLSEHLRELAKEGVGVLLVAHMREEELSWCDEVTKLENSL